MVSLEDNLNTVLTLRPQRSASIVDDSLIFDLPVTPITSSMDLQASQGNARKKRKTAEEHSENRRPPQKSSQFWFQDGNLVLQTENTQYRVHRGVLRIQSSVFDDMLEMPQPESNGSEPSSEELEGCPVVPVTDSTEDWDALLGVLYNTDRYIPETHTLSRQTMLAMLRLGKKYDFCQIRAEAYRQLLFLFPKLPHLEIILPLLSPHEKSVKERHEFEILQVIHDLQIQSALPMAYLNCLTARSMKEILSGRDSPEGPIVLSHQTKDALILGKQQLVASSPSILYRGLIAGQVSAACASDCNDEMNRLLGIVLKDPTDLTELIEGYSSILHHSGLCQTCIDAASREFDAGRKRILRTLPSFFDLPAWDRLTDF